MITFKSKHVADENVRFKGKKEVKVTLEQVTKAQRWSTDVALLFL
jgi:hypothetical protein